MKPKTTIILLIIAVVIGEFVWYDTTHLKETSEQETQAKRVLRGLKSSDITKLEIQNTNGTIVVEKTGEKWQIKKPYEARASKSEVDSILSDLEFLDADRTMTPKDLKEAGGSPASYGLDKPRVEATITAKGAAQTIKLGDETKVGGNLYAMVGGRENIYLIAKSLLEKLSRKIDDLRDRTVIEFSPSDLTKMELKAGNRQIELTKSTEAEGSGEIWRVTRPIDARADKVKVNDMAQKLSDLKVDTFVTEDPKDVKLYGLDEPQQEVSLFTKATDGARIVQFGAAPTNDTTKIYARRKGANSIFTVKNDILTNLVYQVNDLRNRKLAEFEADQVNGAELVIGSQTIMLAKHTNEWQFLQPTNLKPEQSACDEFVSHVHNAEIKQFVADVVTDLAQYGLAKPQFEITLKREKVIPAPKTNEPPKTTLSTNKMTAAESAATTNLIPLVTLQVGKNDAAKGLVYVKRADETFVYGMETNFVAGLPKSVLDLRDRTILEADATSIQRIEIGGIGVPLVTERVTVKGTNNVETQQWRLVSPAQGVLANEAVDGVVSALSEIKAEKLVAEHPANLAEFGLDKPALVIQFGSTATTNAPAMMHTLWIGKESSDKNRFAMVKENPLVFELDNGTYERLSKGFIGKPEEKNPSAASPAPAATTNQPPVQQTNAPAAG